MVTEENIIVNRYRHKKMLLWLLCGVIILTSGVIIGAGGTILLVKQRVIWISRPHKDANEIAQEITEKYGLNPQQTQQVGQLINKAFQQKKLYDEEEKKKREADIQIMIADMNQILTPQQFERWNKDFQAFREKHKKPAKK